MQNMVSKNINGFIALALCVFIKFYVTVYMFKLRFHLSWEKDELLRANISGKHKAKATYIRIEQRVIDANDASLTNFGDTTLLNLKWKVLIITHYETFGFIYGFLEDSY